MKKLWFMIFPYLIISLWVSIVFAAGIPEKHQTDFVQIGRKSSPDLIEFFFDVGDGVNNPIISVDKTVKTFDLNKDTRVQGDLSLGDGTPSDRSFIIDEGAGANNPEIKWDTAVNKWKQFDGTTERDIGAGAGGGSTAINILSNSNPGAEDGVLNWTYAGTGSFATTSTLAEIHDGEKSFVTDFNVQAETLKSSEITISQGLYSQSCQAQFFYFGGDDSVDITATVRNGNDAVVSGSETFILKAATIWTEVNLGFICPSATDIGGDSELANMYLQFEQTGVGNSAIFRHDTVHLGGLIGLTEVVLPDVASARIAVSGAAVITSKSSSLIASVDYNASGSTTVNFPAGVLTVIPAVVVTQKDNTAIISVTNITLTSADILTEIAATGVDFDSDYSIFIGKQGVDAKQTALGFKSNPVVSENINSFGVKVNNAGVVTGENTDWINGNCTNPTPGDFTCIFIGVTFTETPNCSISANIGVDGFSAQLVAVTSSQVQYTTHNASGAPSSAAAHLKCSKSTGDFKLPQRNLILVNQVSTSVEKGLRVEVCRIDDVAGTPTTANALCDSWTDGTTDQGVGQPQLDITSGIFSDEPVCVCVAQDNTICAVSNVSTSLFRIALRDVVTGALEDNDVFIKCTGKR